MNLTENLLLFVQSCFNGSDYVSITKRCCISLFFSGIGQNPKNAMDNVVESHNNICYISYFHENIVHENVFGFNNHAHYFFS